MIESGEVRTKSNPSLFSSMQSTEGGRKLNQAVNTTSKAVGGAITQAKGAFSNWWSSMTTQPKGQIGGGEANDQEELEGEGDDDDLEIVEESHQQQQSKSVKSVVDQDRGQRRGVGQDDNVIINEIGTPAEEFLESEMEVARKEVPTIREKQGVDEEQMHKTGDVFTV